MPQENPLSIHDLPPEQRPRERLFSQGASALSNAELLAIILRTGSRGENVLHLCERLLAHFGGLDGLAKATTIELEQINGLGKAKIGQLMAAIELANRLAARPVSERPSVHNAADAVRLVNDMQHLTQEHVRVILLDSHRRVIAIPTVYVGTVNTSVLRTAEIYREAIIRNSPAIILVHNHPSGDPSPSPEDIHLTHDLIEAGKLLDISLIDHIIIGSGDWRSIHDMGLAFKD